MMLQLFSQSAQCGHHQQLLNSIMRLKAVYRQPSRSYIFTVSLYL